MAWYRCGGGNSGPSGYQIYTIATNQTLTDDGGTKTYTVSGFDYSQCTASNFKAIWKSLTTTSGGGPYTITPNFSFNSSTGKLSLSWGVFTGSSTITLDIICII